MLLLRLVPQSASLLALVVIACGLVGSRPTTSLRAQEPSSSLDEEQREQLYQEITREAAALERQLGIVKKVVKLVSPAVVHIEASKEPRYQPRFGQRGRVEEAGSGVLVRLAKKYYVLTNRHVIKFAEPKDIKIKFSDGREIQPAKVWEDSGSDIAVMRVSARRLIAARLGDSSKVEIGDFVLAVGSPFGLSHSVTYGIISAKGRRDLELGGEGVQFQNFMQTDAAINPGNSGGPLINLRGELIGINTAIASNSGGNEGIGFSIPINMVKRVVDQLIETGSVKRAYLGVGFDDKFGPATAARLGLDHPHGARITDVKQNSPAEEADLKADDVVLRFGGVAVEDGLHLKYLVSLTEIGKLVPMVVFRDRKAMELQVTVADRKNFDPQQPR